MTFQKICALNIGWSCIDETVFLCAASHLQVLVEWKCSVAMSHWTVEALLDEISHLITLYEVRKDADAVLKMATCIASKITSASEITTSMGLSFAKQRIMHHSMMLSRLLCTKPWMKKSCMVYCQRECYPKALSIYSKPLTCGKCYKAMWSSGTCLMLSATSSPVLSLKQSELANTKRARSSTALPVSFCVYYLSLHTLQGLLVFPLAHTPRKLMHSCLWRW